MTLTEGSVKRNQAIVYENLFGDLGLAPTRFKFNVGDRVRIVKKKKAFEKGYTPRWTEKVFTTSKHRDTQRQFSENICSEDDLRSRIFGTFFVKFLACLPLLGFSNI